MGTLYLIATPIGNLEDITARALRLLQEVKLIAVEDTRVAQKLLSHFDIHIPTTSYFEHNKLTKLRSILAALDSGDVALISDAGTPGLNDPGYELVRAALEAGHRVSPVPGPASPIAALTVSGLSTDSFLYLGYLPRKSSERRRLLESIAALPYTLIFLETPHRLLEALKDLHSVLGNRRIAVSRELTKLYEEIWRGLISEASAHFTNPRGEFILVVEGNQNRDVRQWTEQEMQAAIRAGVESGAAPALLSAKLAKESGWKRHDVYTELLELAARRNSKSN